MALVLPKVCSMGGSQTGLVGTIGVALLNPDGTVHTARATAGIYEIGGGCYGKNISFPDNWKGIIKWDTGGGSPVYAVEEYTIDGAAMWDEILTGASHNIPTSAGRRLRQAADALIIREETCQAGGANNAVILDAGASAVDNFYLYDIVILESGTGAGQSRHIDSYIGSSKTAIVNRDWTTNPDATTNYVLRFDSTKHVHGLESTARDQIADAVWLEDLDGYTSGAGKMQQTQIFGKEVIIDTVNGVAGTAFPTGTRSRPVNNLTDALTICAANGLIRIRTRSSLIVGPAHNVDNMSITSHGIMGIDIEFKAGCSAKNVLLRNVNVTGVMTLGDTLLVYDCSIGNLANFTGIMNVCAFGEGCEISLGYWANMIECYCGGEPANEPEVSLGTAGLSMPCYCGNLKFTNKTGGPSTVASFRSGSVSIASSCVAGKIKILGTGELEKNDSGPGCMVDVDAALTNKFIAEHVWAAITFENIKAGSFGEKMALVAGLVQGDYYLDQASYDGAHRLLSGRIRIYSVSGSTGTDADVLATYLVTATWSDTELQTYKVVRQ